jgi:hypothetical protein
VKIEGALTKRFLRHVGIYRSDVSSLLVNLGRVREQQRTRLKTSACGFETQLP